MNKKTKIICTIGPATSSPEQLKKLMLNGMDIARINFSHGTHESHGKTMDTIKKVREELGLPIAILLDTKGPEIRTKLLENDEKVELEAGQTFTLTIEDIIGNKEKVAVTYEDLTKDVVPGNTILIDDGLIELTVKEVTETDVVCEVINGGSLSNRKGVNIPSVNINLPAITEKDKEDIIFGINQGVDFIAASFVRSADAVSEIRKILKDSNSDIAIISKIENEEGINNLDSIIEASDGIMVARGDLGVEVPAECVPTLQKQIIQKCNDAYKPVITATQMLDSMIRNPRPTRAEVTDVANAIYDGTDAIMLSGETAMGKYPIEAVKMMANIAMETESNLDYKELLEEKKVHRSRGISSAICYSAIATAATLHSRVIIASSFSGYTARLVSKFRTKSMVVGLSPMERTLRKMQLYWGVKPILTDEVNSTDNLLESAIGKVKELGYVEKDDTVVLTAGVPAGKTGVTNMIKVVTID
ncbi:pyruvate kinase [Lachnospiraceae bacterium KM106-2]|nr:pyruvate kinase [Lachnospiraceae bacterium KM106-2]